MSVNVNLSAKKDMNLASLKRRFPSVESILVEASLVAIYRYKKKADNTKYWSKENVTGPLFVVQHHSDGIVDHSIIILNQEGRIDFSLSANSVSIIVPQQEFLMLRYLNQDMGVSTLALWIQDYKQRDGVINCIFSSMGLRIGNLAPCNPYLDHRVVEPSASITVDTNTARLKLLDLMRQPSNKSLSSSSSKEADSDIFTDTEISGRPKLQQASNEASTSVRFSNQSGLQLLAKLNNNTPAKPNISSAIAATSPTTTTSTAVSSSISVSPINVYSNPREMFTPPSESRSNLPPPMQPVYPPQHQQQYNYPAQQLFQPSMPQPYMHVPPNAHHPYAQHPHAQHPQAHPYQQVSSQQYPHPHIIPSWPAPLPLRGSPYDPTIPHPPAYYPAHTAPIQPHQYPAAHLSPRDGATSYLLSRFGKPPS